MENMITYSSFGNFAGMSCVACHKDFVAADIVKAHNGEHPIHETCIETKILAEKCNYISCPTRDCDAEIRVSSLFSDNKVSFIRTLRYPLITGLFCIVAEAYLTTCSGQ